MPYHPQNIEIDVSHNNMNETSIKELNNMEEEKLSV